MKVKQEHYQAIKTQIKQAIELNGIEKIDRYYNQIKLSKSVNNPKIRLMYDLMRLSISPQWICDNLYPYCKDEHITTCLLKIGRELDILD